jgi:hypothetical protein
LANDLDRLRYVILPGKPRFGFPATGLYDQAYSFWRQFWTRVLTDVGAASTPEPDEFCRQDLVCLLLDERDEIAAMMCYTFYDLGLRATTDRQYFSRYFTPEFFGALRDRGITRLMSLEYLSVAPVWRRNGGAASLARLISVLGLRQVAQFGCDAGIAAARCDVGVDKLSHELGAESIVRGLKVHGIETDLVAFVRDRIQEPRDPRVADLVARLWDERLDYNSAKGSKRLRSVA